MCWNVTEGVVDVVGDLRGIHTTRAWTWPGITSNSKHEPTPGSPYSDQEIAEHLLRRIDTGPVGQSALPLIALLTAGRLVGVVRRAFSTCSCWSRPITKSIAASLC